MSGSAGRPRNDLSSREWFALRRSQRREWLRLDHSLAILTRRFYEELITDGAPT